MGCLGLCGRVRPLEGNKGDGPGESKGRKSSEPSESCSLTTPPFNERITVASKHSGWVSELFELHTGLHLSISDSP